MSRKPILLVGLLIALGLAAWWIARGLGPGVGGVADVEGRAAQDVAGTGGLTQLSDGAGESRVPSVPVPASAPQVPDAITTAAFSVRGRVVDARRFAAADVEVRLVRPDGTTRSVRSDADGKFEFAMAERAEKYESVAVWALRGEEAAVKLLLIPGSKPQQPTGFLFVPPALGDLDAGTLALRRAHGLVVRVLDSGQPAVAADVSLWQQDLQSMMLWRGKTDDQGTLTTSPLPAGCINVIAERGAADGRARAFLPEETSVQIDLAPRFDATVTVVDKQTGSPISGAAVQINEYVNVPSARDNSQRRGFGEYSTFRSIEGGKQSTDAEGMARYSGLSADVQYSLSVSAPGSAAYPAPGSGSERISLGKPTVRIELERAATRTVRWTIAAGEVPAPAEGTAIGVGPGPGSLASRLGGEDNGPREGLIRGGDLVVDGVEGIGNLLATAPDGSMAQLWVEEGSDVGKPISFRPARTIEVVVRDADGAPVVGAVASARNQGNNPLGQPEPTDAQGIARLTGLYGALADVYVLAPLAGSREVQAGSVDLAKGDGHVEVVISASAAAAMRACLELRIDGVAQLPTDYGLSGAELIEERPESGELLVSVALPDKGAEVNLRVSSTDFLPAKLTLPIVRDGSETRAVLNLTRSSTLTALVKRPPGKEGVGIRIQSWDEAKQAWGMVSPYFNGLHTPNGPHESFRFFQLLPGRYRVLDERSKVESEAVDIAEGQPDAEVELDLASIEWVAGRVEVPDVAELPRVVLLASTTATGPEAAWLPGKEPPKGGYVAADGTFRVQVKRGVPTHLRVWHPWLNPADPGGSLDVDAGREGVVLKLVAGDEVRLAAPQLSALRNLGAARVALFDGPPQGEPRAWIHAPLVDGVLRFSEVPRGRATLWIDPGRGFAPLVLEKVEIGAGVTDLGVAEFPRGSTLRVRLTVKEGTAAPRIYISARRDAAPAMFRDINSNGEEEVLLSGLEAGVYKVSLGTIMAQQRRDERQIEVDGVNDIELPLDLR